MKSTLKLSKDMVDSIRFERMHRSSGHLISRKTRNVVLIFSETRTSVKGVETAEG
ncbi:hypothetical protein DPMN_187106 [Dreissena polymorpha]|uniref:Uncharacterized protein n=1 Tax=Dreissena polymorpha TaxID=45954 RepID=A0A9D4DNV6_DREPO|nr:hypothetical protein DPMN_187106 [Dreissena polymorpha]